jgi:hypothetical protein
MINYKVQLPGVETGSPIFRLIVQKATVGSNPQFRIGGAGAFTNMFTPSPASPYYFESPVGEIAVVRNALTEVWYKDDSLGEVLLCKYFVPLLGAMCSVTRSPDGPHIDRGASAFEVKSGAANFAATYEFSYNDGSTWLLTNYSSLTGRSLSYSPGTGSPFSVFAYTVDNATTPNIPKIRFRRNDTLCEDVYFEDVLVDVVSFPPLSGTISKTDVTTTGGSDGTVSISLSGGSGSRSYLWQDAVTTQNRVGLSAGIYTVTVTDEITEEEIELSITVNEPGIVPPVANGNLLVVPLLNSLHFVVDPVVPDGVSNFQGLDNVLFCDQEHEGFLKSKFLQKVAKGDITIAQFYSNYADHTVQLFKYIDDTFVKSFTVTLKESNIGTVEDFSITIRNHMGSPGQSRAYFTAGQIPIPLEVGDSFEILNNADGFNGVYGIVDIGFDSVIGVQYLVFNKNYAIVASSTGATGRFDVTTLNYNVYESVLDMLDVDDGEYYVKITSFDNDENFQVAVSEPIDLAVSHKGTILLEAFNSNNSEAFDLTWSTGYITRMRVPAIFFQRFPGGEVSTSRNSNYSLVITSAKGTRGILLQTYMLPPYMHEKLSFLFKVDNYLINKQQFKTAEAYADPKYIDEFVLANSTVKVELVNAFNNYNSDDIGTVSEGGFILSDSGFIKR